jgi:hypothetical protein
LNGHSEEPAIGGRAGLPGLFYCLCLPANSLTKSTQRSTSLKTRPNKPSAVIQKANIASHPRRSRLAKKTLKHQSIFAKAD